MQNRLIVRSSALRYHTELVTSFLAASAEKGIRSPTSLAEILEAQSPTSVPLALRNPRVVIDMTSDIRISASH